VPRTGCFEIRISCPRCGQSVPINGPIRTLTCSSCFESFRIPADTFADFFNDFENDYPGLAEGEGTGGTLMSGAGTFKYSYWRLPPRCSDCKKPLVLPEYGADKTVACKECGREYSVYPAPGWITELTPSLKQCVTIEREKSEGNEPESVLNAESAKPIVMSCPQCSGALSISTGNERILRCRFCESEVYIPDAIWTRLHPVKLTEEWFLVFDGKTQKQLFIEQRRIDATEEKEAMKKWRLRRLRKQVRGGKADLTLIIGGAVALFPITAGVMYLAGARPELIGDVLGTMGIVAMILAFLTITLGSAFYMEIAYRWGHPGKCRKALTALAAKHGWEHDGVEHKHYMGHISDKYKGCEFEIHPDDDYAIEIDLDDSPFYLKTEPPGYPSDDVFRFTTGDRRFDELFPIRYAKPEMIKRLEVNQEEVLKPFHWFLDRWEDQLAVLKVGWSGIEAHLAPGHKEQMGIAVRFVYPDELEPFFEDMIVLARGIESTAKGKTPELPESTP